MVVEELAFSMGTTASSASNTDTAFCNRDDDDDEDGLDDDGLDLDDPRGVRLLAAPPAVNTVILLRTFSADDDDDMVDRIDWNESMNE